MKNLPSKVPPAKLRTLLAGAKTPLAEEITHQENITPEFDLGTEPMAHRRTTVTVVRETLSVFKRRTVADPAVAPAKTTSEKTPEIPNILTGGKP